MQSLGSDDESLGRLFLSGAVTEQEGLDQIVLFCATGLAVRGRGEALWAFYPNTAVWDSSS